VLLTCSYLFACSGNKGEISPTLPNQNPKNTVKLTKTISLETQTPGSTITPSIQPTYTSTATPATPDFEATITEQAGILYRKLADFPITCTEFFDFNVYFSPDKQWVTITCGFNDVQNLEVAGVDGSHWMLRFEDYLSKELFKDGIPMGGVYPNHWTTDGRYLFFNARIYGDGGGPCFYGSGSTGLFRLDVLTGKISAVLPITQDYKGYEFAFSPNGRWLAYYLKSFLLLDLQTGKITTMPGKNVRHANFIWSPDGEQIAYVTCELDQTGNSVERSTVEIFSLESTTSKIIYESEEYTLNIERWNNNQLLWIYYEDNLNDDSSLYYNWSIKQLVTPTPTPKP